VTVVIIVVTKSVTPLGWISIHKQGRKQMVGSFNVLGVDWQISKKKIRQTALIPLLLVVLLMFSTGCGKKEEAPSPSVVSADVIAAQKSAEESNRKRIEAEQKAAVLEKSARAAEDASQKYQSIAIGLGVVAVLALLVGIGMGSSARKDAAKAKKSGHD
jgi:hypothetical protein